jgi:hypothetical protein
MLSGLMPLRRPAMSSIADETGEAVVSIEVVVVTPSLRTSAVCEANANDGDPEIWCGEV